MSLADLTLQQWICGLLGALCIGFGKGGLPGLGNLAIWFFAMAFEPKQSVGILLPALICGDIVAVLVYRKHADFRYVRRLLPWSMLGVVIGFFLFNRIPGDVFSVVIGGMLLAMTGVHFLRQWLLRKRAEGAEDPIPHKPWFIGGTGIAGGVATMLANAAGPIASFYFMAIRLPKMAFIGTSAWFFFLINIFKLPFQSAAGNLTLLSLQISLVFGAAAIVCGLIAPKVVRYIPQRYYSACIWTVIIFAAISLIVG
ncbi:sulfite exporter TauE/SafE family protein [Ruficoccus amylovorans]|uniref:Probable membrane transporter protein n=1 Tax=Ruficoccus amylovorans TaxID=1804625 RepID=A0A842HCA2_9BACT|nr:sulfite exporter TauE/SafE family protein [Ruficoccus amylovorans]MBC2594093.1 sulfite exporter TauE/SafE family protein [Ruficoccus amylovorans]